MVSSSVATFVPISAFNPTSSLCKAAIRVVVTSGADAVLGAAVVLVTNSPIAIAIWLRNKKCEARSMNHATAGNSRCDRDAFVDDLEDCIAHEHVLLARPSRTR